MLTPQEVSEHTFSKASFGGYNMAMVDEFLDLVSADYTSLYNDNAVLKSKMKVLADKVEEYRSTEEAMRKALLTAQRLADEMVHEAESKKAALLQEAEADAKVRMDQLKQELAAEEYRLGAAKKATADYVAQVRTLSQAQLTALDGLSQLIPPDARQSQPSVDPVSVAAMEIEDTIQKLIAEEMPQSAPKEEEAPDDLSDTLTRASVSASTPREEAAPEPAPDEDDGADATRRIDFDNLMFGRDFEIR